MYWTLGKSSLTEESERSPLSVRFCQKVAFSVTVRDVIFLDAWISMGETTSTLLLCCFLESNLTFVPLTVLSSEIYLEWIETKINIFVHAAIFKLKHIQHVML